MLWASAASGCPRLCAAGQKSTDTRRVAGLQHRRRFSVSNAATENARCGSWRANIVPSAQRGSAAQPRCGACLRHPGGTILGTAD